MKIIYPNHFSIVFLFCLSANIVVAQIINGPIKVGESVPDVNIGQIINYKAETVKISDYKGKLLILDFWATWCAPCLESFPKIDSLRKKYNGEMEILLVSNESKNIVSKFLERFQKLKNLSLPSITGDTRLASLFPHIYLPHYVWIDKKGTVIAITGSDEVNNDNLKSILTGKIADIRQKRDRENDIVTTPTGNYTLFAPSVLVRDSEIAKLENIPPANIKFQSLLTGYTPGLVMGGSFAADGSGISLRNVTVRNLYRAAFLGNSIQSLNANSILVEIPDSTLYGQITISKRSSSSELVNWLEQFGYCYNLTVSPELREKIKEIMLRDLNAYFGPKYGIEGKFELRNCKYLALVRTNDQVRFASKTEGSNSSVGDRLSLKIINGTFTGLISELTLPLQKYPIIVDETNYGGSIDLELNCLMNDIDEVNKELSKYGLKLTEKVKRMKIGVIGMLSETTQ